MDHWTARLRKIDRDDGIDSADRGVRRPSRCARVRRPSKDMGGIKLRRTGSGVLLQIACLHWPSFDRPWNIRYLRRHREPPGLSRTSADSDSAIPRNLYRLPP